MPVPNVNIVRRPEPVVSPAASRKTVWVNSVDNMLEMDLMRKCNIWPAQNIDSADFVFFVGGADVDPRLYGEEPLPETFYNDARDAHDIQGWRYAGDKFKIGVCRGGQFLNVMNGGRLWQDVNGHALGAKLHAMTDRFTGQTMNVTSTHHQQFRPAPTAVVIATAHESTQKKSGEHTWQQRNNNTVADKYFQIDHEVLYYPESKSLCFQPHPEYQGESVGPTRDYFMNVFRRILNNEVPLDKLGIGLDMARADKKETA